MTDLVQYYKDLLIIQYADKPKALATIGLFAEMGLLSNLPLDVQNAFDLDTAVGVQLDTLGKYVGVVRRVRTETATYELNDTDFRTMIAMAIMKNSSYSSLYDIQNLINIFFPGTLYVIDYQTMKMSYVFDSALISFELAQTFIANSLLPRPMGVDIDIMVYTPNAGRIFRFASAAAPTAISGFGFNTAADFALDTTWLSYDNVNFL